MILAVFRLEIRLDLLPLHRLQIGEAETLRVQHSAIDPHCFVLGRKDRRRKTKKGDHRRTSEAAHEKTFISRP
jgi:hypothetical protein